MGGFAVDLQDEFQKTVLAPEGRMDLARAGLLVSRLAYPDLDEPALMAQLDDLGARLRAKVSGLRGAVAIARAMGRLLCKEDGFRGNSKDYYDPDNSYLNCVLERRTGIPITLSLLYMEVGRRAGLDVRGIGMPGHFLVGVYEKEERIFLDPFYSGTVLNEKECRRRAAVQHQGALVWNSRFLEPSEEKAMIVRLLRNLRAIYGNLGDVARSLQALEWIIALAPDAATEYKTRGFLSVSLGAFESAVKDLEKYIALQPDAPDALYVQATIDRLTRTRTTLH